MELVEAIQGFGDAIRTMVLGVTIIGVAGIFIAVLVKELRESRRRHKDWKI